jgi:hypothetical protein
MNKFDNTYEKIIRFIKRGKRHEYNFYQCNGFLHKTLQAY